MNEKMFWPRTLTEMRAEIDAYELNTQYPPGDVRRYQSVDEAYRLGREQGETIYRGDLLPESYK